jgi:UDP-N-acetylmuramoyl-L-alanyl-D-glutamate--2,6-diaminopimelate ligase
MASLRTLVKKIIPTTLFRQIEPTGHLIEAVAMNIVYGFPGRKLRVIGVTGTNGKTTTSFMIHRMLHEAGYKVALLTTVATGIGDDIIPQHEHVTTAKASVLQKKLREFAKAGVEWVVIETSSHSLAQHRVWGVPYEIGVLTNITNDHLDYHKTFERYVDAKRQLFVLANRRGLRAGVVNADDPSAEKFIASIKHPITYGIKNGQLKASKIKLAADHSQYTVTTDNERYSIRVNIPGEFNVSNSLAALGVGRALGLSVSEIEWGIAAVQSVEGRMNVIDAGQSFKVIVDFASTPDAFENFFKSVRPLTKGKLIAVFGSAGRRDTAKRPQQGSIASTYADVVILTEEDDRDEDGMTILSEIAAGATAAGKKEGENLHLVLNREEAIGFAMAQATSKDDVVVLLGKGHEKTIERADGEYPWNEADVARAALESLQERS